MAALVFAPRAEPRETAAFSLGTRGIILDLRIFGIVPLFRSVFFLLCFFPGNGRCCFWNGRVEFFNPLPWNFVKNYTARVDCTVGGVCITFGCESGSAFSGEYRAVAKRTSFGAVYRNVRARLESYDALLKVYRCPDCLYCLIINCRNDRSLNFGRSKNLRRIRKVHRSIVTD